MATELVSISMVPGDLSPQNGPNSRLPAEICNRKYTVSEISLQEDDTEEQLAKYFHVDEMKSVLTREGVSPGRSRRGR